MALPRRVSFKPTKRRLVGGGRLLNRDGGHRYMMLISSIHHLGLQLVLPNQSRQEIGNALQARSSPGC